MPKTTKTKISELPISLSIKITGQDQLLTTSNVLKSLRELAVDVQKIKSKPIIEITYGKETYRKMFAIPVFKKLLVNDILRQIVAKNLNTAVGIKLDSYE